MEQNHAVTPEKDIPLRYDIRLLGRILGDTVRAQEGDQVFELVEPTTTYVLKPGDAHFYDIGVVHSPKRDGLTRLVRIEGTNLDHIKRSNIKAAETAPAK